MYAVSASSLRLLTTIDQSAEAALATAAHKEIAYLKHFGQPLLPLRRERRPAYKYQPQSPSYHVENLERYLAITSSLVPKDPALSRFCIRHPDLQPNNIFVSRSPDSGCKVVSLFDWQHTSILPMFLHAGIPQQFQNYGDSVSESMTLPSLPENLEELSEPTKSTCIVVASFTITTSPARRSATSSTMPPSRTNCTRSVAVSSYTPVARGRARPPI